MVYDVIAVGSATTDVFVNTFNELIQITTPKSKESLIAYPIGTKILIKDLRFYIGGGGTNTAVTFAKMGLKTGYLGKLGTDHNTGLILDLLKKHKIDFLGNTVNGVSGYSVILDSIAHDRTILTYKGVNNDLTKKDFKLNPTKWYYFSSMVEKSFNALLYIAKNSKKAKCAFNPSAYQVSNDQKKVVQLLKYIDLLIFNQDEAKALVNEKNDVSPFDLFPRLHKLGPKMILITDGSKGCFGSDGEKYYSLKPRKIKVVESTGAGDAFASGFLSSLIKGNNFEKSMVVGLTNAESVITHLGAKNKILSYNQALSIIRSKPVKVRQHKK